MAEGLAFVCNRNTYPTAGPVCGITELLYADYARIKPHVPGWHLSSTLLGGIDAELFSGAARRLTSLGIFDRLKLSPLPGFHISLDGSDQRAVLLTISFYGIGGTHNQRKSVVMEGFNEIERRRLIRDYYPLLQSEFVLPTTVGEVESKLFSFNESHSDQTAFASLWNSTRRWHENVHFSLSNKEDSIHRLIALSSRLRSIYSWEIESVQEPESFADLESLCCIDLFTSAERTKKQPDFILDPEGAVRFYQTYTVVSPRNLALLIDDSKFRTARFDWLLKSSENKILPLTLMSDKRSARLYAQTDGLNEQESALLEERFSKY